jgi:hypothetical protein
VVYYTYEYIHGQHPVDDYEHYRGRLREYLEQLIRLDTAIQDLLEENEYTADVETSEKYIDSAKRGLLKARWGSRAG